MKNIEKELAENKIVLVVLKKDKYVSQISDIVKVASVNSQKISYVTFNQPYSSLIATYKEKKIDPAKFIFIDTVTRSVQMPKPVDNCLFVSSPHALTEISVAFSKTLNEGKCDSAVFDSLSTLLVYENVNSIIQFTHNVITKLRVKNGRAVFIALKEDVTSQLMKDLFMFVDKVIEF